MTSQSRVRQPAARWALALLAAAAGLGAVEPRLLENDAAKLLAEGKCVEAIGTLDSLGDAQRDERWFHLIATSNLMCARGETASVYQKKAHEWLTVGARRFPGAISLRIEHAQILLAEAAWTDAARVLEEARALLLKELERQLDPSVLADVRTLLKRVDSYLKRAREHRRSSSS